MIFDSLDLFKDFIASSKKVFNLIALDLGEKKIGAAFFNSAVNIAVPLAVFDASNITAIYAALLERKIDGVLIGVATAFDQDESEKRKKKALAFANNILAKIPISITFVDERYTSKIADTMLRNAGMNRKKRNQLDDAVAAQIMLQDFIDKL